MSSSLVSREFNGFVIQQRQTDGYINLNQMAKACSKRIDNWMRLKETHSLLREFTQSPEYQDFKPVITIEGRHGGSWGHPDIAIQFAQWCSPSFALQVSRWVREWLTTGRNPILSYQMPYHLERYLANRQCVPYTHFSILAQLTLYLIAPLESLNYSLPEKMLPDISEGLLFNRWLREYKNFDTDALPTYVHTYEDGRQVRAKLYPIELLPDFIRHFYEVWLPERAPDYFATRDSTALPLMPKLLEARLTKSLTDLLKEHNAPYSAQKMNKILLQMGILEEKTRPSSKGGEKKFKAFTEEGRIYGKNLVKPQKPEETHPYFYEDTFEKLLIIVENYLYELAH